MKKQSLPILDAPPYYVFPTKLPGELCDAISNHFEDIEVKAGTATNKKAHRRCGVRWTDPDNWVGPFIWRYIEEANQTYFQYDVDQVFMTEIHQIEYRPGHYYHWHEDDSIATHIHYAKPNRTAVKPDITEYVRKLSFSLQLSDPEDYTGGDVQIVHDVRSAMLTVPKERGTLCIFDSRTRHRVKPVKTGKRFVLVGWVIGPRWK